MLNLLGRVGLSNKTKAEYYEGEQRIAPSPLLPKQWRKVARVAGWAGTVVDVLEERLDLYGFQGAPEELDAVFERNNLASESSLAHLDALIYGVAFVAVDSGGDLPLVTVESPTAMTGVCGILSSVA